jgi:hypothetical protein
VKLGHRFNISENANLHLYENKKSNIHAGLLKKQLFAPYSKLVSPKLFFWLRHFDSNFVIIF